MKKTELLFLLLPVFMACGNNEDKKAQAETSVAKQPTAMQQSTGKPAQAQLDDAKSKGKVAFFVLTANDTAGTGKAVAIAENVSRKVANTMVITVNRDDAANAPVIEKWQLSSIPTPAIFIISARGIPVTSFSLEEANEAAIIRDIPSPRMEDAYVALDEKKAVIMLVSGKMATGRDKIAPACNTAAAQLKEKATFIEVDAGDSREKTLLENFKIATATPTVVVLNADGETTGTFTGTVTAAQLVAAATKVVKTPCCADGEPCK